jgi:hypothetical protein
VSGFRGRVLFLNYDFPPALSGVRRILKFCRHLPKQGWQPEVLCAKPYDQLGRDEEALRELESLDILVTRTRSWDPLALRSLLLRRGSEATPGIARASQPEGPGRRLARRCMGFLRSFLLPDDRVGWLPFVLWSGLGILRRKTGRPHVLVTSSYPNTAHLAGWLLKKWTGVPWVADFRDGWTQNPYFGPPRRGLRRWIQTTLEAAVVRKADAVLAVSRPIAEHLERVRGRDGVVVLPNGFDPADYPDPPRPAIPGRIGYTGTFFGGRSPRVFLRALVRALRSDQPADGQGPEGGVPATNAVHGVFQTRLSPGDQAFLDESPVRDRVEIRPMGSHASALALQQESSLLLLVEPEGPGSQIMLTQKVFEYLGADRPILALVPRGACRELLEQTGGAWILAPYDEAGVARVLREWLTGALPPPRHEDRVATYQRSHQAGQLADLLNQLLDGAQG